MATLIRGHVDSTGGGFVMGWAASDRDEPVEIVVLIDGVAVTQTRADRFRQDLLDAGIGTGHCGFQAAVPAYYFDGMPHTIAVQVAGATILHPDPAHVVLGEPPPAAVPGGADLRPLHRPAVPRPAPQPVLPAPALHAPVAISVILPTYGRGAVLEATLLRLLACASRVSAEIIVIDDGSRDDTPDRLRRLAIEHPALVTHRVENGGPARARNLAATMARGQLLVFVGDDVSPPSDDFLSIHAAAHTRFPETGTAVLGRIGWPDRDALPVNAVMAHIQGEGEQQFGFHNMTAYSWYDWRLFYSSNVSVKKALVSDWLTHGYDSSFTMAAFEDPEFALRMSQRLNEVGEAFRLFYAPAAYLAHHHSYSVASFIARQVSVGMMAQRFLELHPPRAADLGLSELVRRLAMPSDGGDLPVEHYFSVFEGLKSWALIIEHHYGLGQQNWHGDLLRTVFRLAYLEGFLRVQSGTGVNVAAGCRYVLEDVRTSMDRAIATEVLGALPGFGLV